MPGIGPVRLQRLVEHLGSLAAAWRATPIELARAGLDDRSAQTLIERRARLDLTAELARCEQAGVTLVAAGDPRYPKRLAEIYGAPFLLYVRGDLLPTDDLAIAVVGTRRATPYGQRAVEKIAADLAAAGVTIVSGLARGIDTCRPPGGARQPAVGRSPCSAAAWTSTTRPRTRASPPRSPSTAPSSRSTRSAPSPTPRTSRPATGSSAGSARGTLVIEAGEKSGALITAKFAVEQNRDVFAVPGSIFAPQLHRHERAHPERREARLVRRRHPRRAGRRGGRAAARNARALPLDEQEAKIASLLSAEPKHFDELCRESGLAASEVGATLTLLELKGLARDVGGTSYILGVSGRAESTESAKGRSALHRRLASAMFRAPL